MTDKSVKSFCPKRGVSGVVIFFIVMATASTVVSETGESALEFQLPDCSKTGGVLDQNRCVCKAGYTGSKCDISLDDDLKYAMGDRNNFKLTFEVLGMNDYSHVRVRRQSEGSGAGDINDTETTSAAPDATAAGPDATAAQAATPAPSASTATPSSNATAATPASNATAATPASNATAATPASNATAATPASNATAATPASNATAATPASNATAATPASNATAATPASNATAATPASNATAASPASNATAATPASNATAATPASNASAATPASNATEVTPASNATATTTTSNATATPAPNATDSSASEAAPATTAAVSNVTTATSNASAQTVTSAPATCPAGKVRNSTSGCTDATSLQGQMTINNINFTSDLNNLSSPVSQSLIATITAEVGMLMAGTSFNRLDITSFSNGSVVVNGLFVFEQTASSVSELLALSSLLQSRMVNTNSSLQIAQLIAIDTDECAGNTFPCPNNTACANTPGSFTCACLSGYKPTFANGLLDVCTPQCASVQCLNGGSCVVENNSTFCSCPAQFSGTRCEADSFPLQQATIAVSVVLGVLVFIALVLIIFVLCHKTRSKKKTSNDLPLGTGFKTTMDDDFPKQVYDNPQDVASDENRSSLRIEEEQHEPDNYTNATSTFKPDEGAAKAEDDDKL